MLDKSNDRIDAWIGRQVVSGPKATALARRGVRRWAEAAGLDGAAAAELLDMLDIAEAEPREGVA